MNTILIQHLKKCNNCNNIKPIIYFPFRKDNNCYRKKCKKCTNEDKKVYYKNNQDKVKASAAKWKRNNKEYIEEYRKNWRKDNRDILKEKAKIYRDNNKILVSKSNRKYYENNKSSDKHKLYDVIYSSKRRALKISTEDGTINPQSLRKLFIKQDGKCNNCKCKLDTIGKNKVHLDHYMPLSKGGTHTLNNVIYLCKECNLSKGCSVPSQALAIAD